MAKDSNQIIFLLLALIVAVFSSMYIAKEGFTNLSPGIFTKSLTEPILYPTYPKQNNPLGISDMDSQQLWQYSPVFDNTYKQYTNNVRYWATPNNGKCSRAEMCGGLYDNKKMDIPPPPKPTSWNSNDIRVNFYDSLSC